MTTTLYRLFNAGGSLLYIGVTNQLGNRLLAHRNSDRFDGATIARVEIEEHATRDEALEAERKAIRAECPEYNVHYNWQAETTLPVPTSNRLALSVDEVAASLGVGRDCVYRAIKAGEIPSVKVGARVVIPRRWLEDLLNGAAAAVSDALTPSARSGVDASETGTAGTTAEPEFRRAHVDDRTHPLPEAPSGPAVHSQQS